MMSVAEKITTQEALKKLDAQLECSLCLDTFNKPKLLPCFHVFCKSPCLEKLVARDRRSLTCPTCRHIVPLTEKGVAGLQSDFHIDRLFEVRNAFKKAEESTETQCVSCEEEIATGYCHDCEDFLCDDCHTAHKKVRLTKNHQLVTLQEFQTQATNVKKDAPRCKKHSNKKLKIYCDTCKELICNDCTVRLHKDHNYDLLADVFPKYKEELVSSLKPLKQKLDRVQQALKVFDTRAKEISDQRATLEADIHKEIDQLQQLLDQRRVELVGELDMLTQQKLKSLTAQQDIVEITQTKLASCLEYAENGLQTGSEGDLLAMTAPVLKRIEQISAEFDSNTIEPPVKADLELVTEGREKLQLACKGFLEIIDRVDAFNAHNSQIVGDGSKVATKGKMTKVVFQARTIHNKEFKGEVALVAELVHIKSKERLQCEVEKQQGNQHTISYLPLKNGRHELHLFVNGNPARGSPFPIAVTPGECTKVVSGLEKPRCTAVNSKGQIIVVEEQGSHVSVLTPEGVKIQTFGTNGVAPGKLSNAYGVTVDSDDNIYVADRNNHRIQKFTSKGNFIATVGSKGNGDLQFSNPRGICYNHRDKNLYIADQWNHRIQVLTTDLKFVRRFGTQGSGSGQFQYPWQLAIDAANCVYVTDNDNNRVQVLTTGGKFLRAFSQKGSGQKLSRPFAIAIDSNNTVYVSEEGNSVSVFTPKGAYITTFGGEGSEEGQFRNIYGISIDPNDSVIVSDQNNGRLQMY